MKLWRLINLSVQNLFSHKGRTFLTLSGIIVSVASIMSVITMGANIKEYILGEIDAFGSDIIQIEISLPETEHVSSDNLSAMAMGVQITTLTDDDGEAIKKLENVQTYNVGVIGQSEARYDGDTIYVSLLGSSADAPIVDTGIELSNGRFFTKEEELSAGNVIVLGHTVAELLFENQDNIIGKRITMNNGRYRVVGVLKERGMSFGFSYDDFVYIPYTTLQKKILGIDYLSYITAKVIDVTKINDTVDDIEYILRSRHDIEKSVDDDFNAMTMEEAKDIFESVLVGINILLIALASISLLVGGIGIMNIMIVSVEERTSEIGLRKAVGARRSDILQQFVIESVIISISGALIGVIFASILISVFFAVLENAGFTSLNLFIPISAISISLLFSVVAGILFGVYPARQAAEVSPMDALRS
jgi:putative ABC transport system permease protein